MVIILNVLLLALIALGVVSVIYYRRQLKHCSARESDVCYTIHCPVDNPKSPPCYGFAKRREVDSKGKERFYCSNAPSSSVNSEGKPVK